MRRRFPVDVMTRLRRVAEISCLTIYDYNMDLYVDHLMSIIY